MPISRLSPANFQEIVIYFDSNEINAGNISNVLQALNTFSGSSSAALKAEGTISLVFHGYQDDPRELCAIPEVREWFAKLYEAWPYWSFFACRANQTLPLIISLLLDIEVVAIEPGKVGWNFDKNELNLLLDGMLAYQNDLIEKLMISEEVNERVNQDFYQAIKVLFN